jgi:hypothetical protein
VKFDPELNTKVEENSPRFPMVLYTPSNGQRFRCNDFWTMTGFAGNWNSGQIAPLYRSGFWRNFAMISPETSYTKNVANELSFLLVTHVTWFDIRFGLYGILMSG